METCGEEPSMRRQPVGDDDDAQNRMEIASSESHGKAAYEVAKEENGVSTTEGKESKEERDAIIARLECDTSDSDDFLNSEQESEPSNVAIIPSKKQKKSDRQLVIVWECVNPSCNVRSKSQLETARDFVTRFYGVEVDQKKKRKVCWKCLARAENLRDEMKQNLFDEENCFESYHSFPLPKDVVTLDDSDEELVEDTSSESEYEIDLFDTDLSEDRSGTEALEALVNATLKEKLNLGAQISNGIQSVESSIERTNKKVETNDQMFREIEKDIDSLRESLYVSFRPRIEELKSMDLGIDNSIPEPLSVMQQVRHVAEAQTLKTTKPKPHYTTTLPPPGRVVRPDIRVGDKVYAMRGNILHVWRLGTVTYVDPAVTGYVKVQFDVTDSKGNIKSVQSKMLMRKHLAYSTPSPVLPPVGTRIISIYRDLDVHDSQFYAGVIAEPPKVMNRFRFLVFFDDGYASYVPHSDIRIVCSQSSDVWEDVHVNSKEFIKKYLSQYPERPMVKLAANQTVRTEWQGRWWITNVLEVDASLAKLQFKADGRMEWIYRGSTRLGPLYMEMQQRNKKLNKEIVLKTARRHNPIKGPYVEYTRQVEETKKTTVLQGKRHVARKSTGAKRQEIDEFTEILSQKESYEGKGEVTNIEVEERVRGCSYFDHECSSSCLSNPKYHLKDTHIRKYNPLLIPIVLGWKRQITKHKNQGKRSVFYIAPCGRRLRNITEVHRYLRLTLSKLEIDFFNFDWYVHVHHTFKPERVMEKLDDISYGKENVPVPCVNSVDRSFPEYLDYSCVRLPQKNVNINTDENFLVCCDCVDDCQDREKCECIQLTIQNTVARPEGTVDSRAGYQYRRLNDQVPTGIFECNSRCKCKSTCLNRVAQHPLRAKLQVFKTDLRGWGIRTLCDIPQGSFICIYVGHLYSNEESNVIGQNYGDEYFAELDMIETIERCKEGYESDCDENLSDVEELSPFQEESSPSTEEEEMTELNKEARALVLHGVESSSASSERRLRKRKEKEKQEQTHDDSDSNSSKEAKGPKGKFKGFSPSTKMKSLEEKKDKYISTRKLFGPKEEVYVMDAKSKGNIGRYLNHSCTPNVFVQNCFIDTHDLRFPWLAFFSSSFIRAGTELCWDYNYIVDQVVGKEIYCSCGSDTCRGRLL